MKLLAIATLIALLACTVQLTPEQQEFKTICAEHNDPWMKMSEMKNGFVIGKPCYGCMPDEKNHICTQEEYLTHK